MANPQTENGFTPIANEILEHLVEMHLSPNQWQVLLFIIRKTYGFHKKVDYIANFQIVEATRLCKAVVSRSLLTLEKRNLINRLGKHIGFQKDWERWMKLAESSTKVSNSVNKSGTQKLAVQSTELAESSTKVSSPAVAQKIKDTLQKIEKAPLPEKQSLEEYRRTLKERYPALDFDAEVEKFNLYWSEGSRKLRRPKLALRNWMDRAERWRVSHPISEASPIVSSVAWEKLE